MRSSDKCQYSAQSSLSSYWVVAGTESGQSCSAAQPKRKRYAALVAGPQTGFGYKSHLLGDTQSIVNFDARSRTVLSSFVCPSRS
jgi:hypothetical protein